MDNNNNFGSNSNDNLNNSFGNTPDIACGNDQPINPYSSSDYSQPINPYANSGYGQTSTDSAASSYGSSSSSIGQTSTDYSQSSFGSAQPSYGQTDYSQSSYGTSSASAPIFQQQAQNYAPQQSTSNAYHMQDLETPVTMGDWIVTLILCCIPCVNIIMLFVWAFSKTEPKSKSNWAKAQLIFVGVVLVIYIVFFVIVMGSSLSAYQSMMNH